VTLPSFPINGLTPIPQNQPHRKNQKKSRQDENQSTTISETEKKHKIGFYEQQSATGAERFHNSTCWCNEWL